jgi:inner membrane protein involved in colicin E2 resistance
MSEYIGTRAAKVAAESLIAQINSQFKLAKLTRKLKNSILVFKGIVSLKFVMLLLVSLES